MAELDPRTEGFYFSPEWRKFLVDSAEAEIAAMQAKAGTQAEVVLTMGPAAEMICEEARKVEADLLVIYVDTGVDETPENQRTLAQNIRFAENLGSQVVRTEGKSVAEAVAKIVREKHITQVVFGRSAQKGWRKYLYLSAIHKFLRDAPPVDVHIVTQEMK